MTAVVRDIDKPYIHPYAVVDKTVIVGPRTRVWQFASVIRGAVVGEDCSIASTAIVDGSRLGDRVIVSHGAFIDPGMSIGNDVFIGPQVSLCNDYWPRVSKEGWFEMRELVLGSIIVTKIMDGASVGANAVLMPGVHIGQRAMIAAGSVVTRSVPMDCLYRRDGVIVPVDPARIPDRKRAVQC